MRKYAYALLALAAVSVGALFLLPKMSKGQSEYEFLNGASLSEKVIKDPRFGGGQREVYQLSGSADEISTRIESELGAKPVSQNRSFRVFKDGEKLIYVGQGRATKWDEYIAMAQSWGTDQASQELYQKDFHLESDPSTVAIAIDRPLIRPVEEGINKTARAISPPPKSSPETNFKFAMARRGKDVVLTVTYANYGLALEDLIVIKKVSLGGEVATTGLPHRVAGLKPGGSGSVDLLFKGVGPGESKVRIEYDQQHLIGGKPELIESFFEKKEQIP